MKFGQVLLIVITSIVTFIGLAISKLYDKYVKNNIVVQGMVYLFFTLIALRILGWAAKPFIPHGIPRFLQHIDLSNITINIPEVTPIIALLIFVVALIGACIFIRHIIKALD